MTMKCKNIEIAVQQGTPTAEPASRVDLLGFVVEVYNALESGGTIHPTSLYHDMAKNILNREPPQLEPCCVCGAGTIVRDVVINGEGVQGSMVAECVNPYHFAVCSMAEEYKPQFIARVNRMNKAGRTGEEGT